MIFEFLVNLIGNSKITSPGEGRRGYPKLVIKIDNGRTGVSTKSDFIKHKNLYGMKLFQ